MSEETQISDSAMDAATAAFNALQSTSETPETQGDPDDNSVEVETQPENSSEENQESSETEVETPEDPSLESAKILLSALEKGGTAAATVLQMIADKAGLKVQFQQTPEIVVRGLKDILNEKLGEDYSFLSEKISEGLDEYLQAQIKPLNQQLNEFKAQGQRQAVQSEINQAASQLEQFADFKTLEPEMLKLSKKMLPTAEMSPSEYLTTLYKAAGGKSVKTAAPQNNAPKRANSPALDRGPQKQAVVGTPEINSTKDAARLALEQLTSAKSLKN